MISPETPPLERQTFLCFFCFAGARPLRAGGADSVKPCPPVGGHPKGSGLEGIRGASYALDVPAKQKPSPFVSSGLLENDYYLQEAREGSKNPLPT